MEERTESDDTPRTGAHVLTEDVSAPPRRADFLCPRDGRDREARETRFLVNEAFREPTNGIAYYVSQRLAELFPDRALVEYRGHNFDPVRYAAKGHCHIRVRPVPYPHWILNWEETRDPLGKTQNGLWQGWCEIEWEDERLEVLILHWMAERGHTRHCFILAERRETAVRFLRTVCAWQAKPVDELLVYQDSEWEKDKLLLRAIKASTFENLVLPSGMKERILADAQTFFSSAETYRRYGVPWKRGILFVGPPGNGKTHALKALVNALGMPCLYVKSFRGHNGPDEYSIAAVFAKARRSAPCILVFEDLDTMVTERNRSFFLNELDGFAGNEGILTLATSNHPEKLDPAIAQRPSRFDRTYQFALPELEERRAFLREWNEGLDAEMRMDAAAVDEVAEFSGGFSFAYLKELCLSGIVAWFAARQPGTMDTIMREQVVLLRGQLSGKPGK